MHAHAPIIDKEPPVAAPGSHPMAAQDCGQSQRSSLICPVHQQQPGGTCLQGTSSGGRLHLVVFCEHLALVVGKKQWADVQDRTSFSGTPSSLRTCFYASERGQPTAFCFTMAQSCAAKRGSGGRESENRNQERGKRNSVHSWNPPHVYHTSFILPGPQVPTGKCAWVG